MSVATSTQTIPGYIAGTWTIDPSHSVAAFTVRHMMVSKVRGRFDEFSGTIVTAENPADSQVNAEITLASINTGNEQRDAHLRSPDFFHTDETPVMTYRSTGMRNDGGSWVLEGELTLKGVTKSVPLAVELDGIGPDAYGGVRAGFSAHATILRSDFDVTWNAAIEGGGVVVSDKVEINLDIQAVLQQ